MRESTDPGLSGSKDPTEEVPPGSTVESAKEAIMDNLEKARTQAEAQQSEQRMTSADRSRFWAGLNRYLRAEAAHAQHAAERDEDLSDGATRDTNREC